MMDTTNDSDTAQLQDNTTAAADHSTTTTTIQPPPPTEQEYTEEEFIQFQIELEFVQLLANPFYLRYLAQHKYFEDKSFVNYLKYLRYWKRPEYAKFILYPHCLHYLDQLQDEEFRDACASGNFTDRVLVNEQMNHWRYYRSNRERDASEAMMMAKTTAGITSLANAHNANNNANN